MKVDIFFDTICPWCRIGKNHLIQAIETWKGDKVDVRFRAFLLDASVPTEGRDYSLVIDQFGGKARVDTMFAQVCKIGEVCGLNFHFDRIKKMPNTMLSHRLIKLAPKERKSAVIELISKAYFEDGLDIGRMDTLLEIADRAELNQAEMKKQLLSQEGIAEIHEDVTLAQKVGIRSIPYFIINDRYSLQNPQSADSFLEAFERIKEKQFS
ncbi:hypothetical protein B1A99_25820 [Cohnella sp. CIP 111063]|uniref:DsbA family oxidoreductase n=1 Tax=unclassified Cohnella TaxID=2636738 RepID=UPI000B8BFF75|nr:MULTISPECIES: DsbA family oxidoreductase [unclassified Cohnella]OXS54747.1 hypothetical protein B1A99_25820 [Cohnella sp. CIP 111063]PRX64583.1 putative DsbA family dithiol-disulfide isomerase [Cohnella sp. SGD-V74]